MPLTPEQFNAIQQTAEPIIQSLKRGEALALARQLETQIAGLEISDPELFQKAQKIVIKLKWAACPIIKDDMEFFGLVRNGLLEGLEETPDETIDIIDQTTERLALQFGVGLEETLRGLIMAIRENTQQIGANPIMVKNESRPVRPVIRNWLIDFLRNVSSPNPTEIEETEYLFNNPNAKTLSEADQKMLGKVLAFYDILRSMAKELAQETREQILSALPEAKEPVPPPATPRQGGAAPPRFSVPEISPSPGPTQFPPAPVAPTAPATAMQPPGTPPSVPRQPEMPPRQGGAAIGTDTYREPIAEEDLSGPSRTAGIKPAPRIEGNIIDLKDFGNNK